VRLRCQGTGRPVIVGCNMALSGRCCAVNIIAMTMAYNEGTMLRRWLRHYGQHLGSQSLLVIDHGSNDGSTAYLGDASRIRLPRDDAGYDEGIRVEFVNGLQASLLKFYDAVLYVDCDEFLVPDPRKFANLAEYLIKMRPDCVRPVGLDIVHNRTTEPKLDDDGPVLAHRQYCKFMTAPANQLLPRSQLIGTSDFMLVTCVLTWTRTYS
jgi:hypothetical protein